MLGGSQTAPDHILVEAAISLASGASENVRRLNANYGTLQNNIVDIAESYIQLSRKLQEAELKNERLAGLVTMLLDKEDEREERWEKHMNLCVFGDFDQVVEKYRLKNGPSNERALDGTGGYKFSETDRWGRKSDEVFRTLMEVMGCPGDYAHVHVKRYPIPPKVGYVPAGRRRLWQKHAVQHLPPPEIEPETTPEADDVKNISSRIRSLSLSGPHAASPSAPRSDHDIEPDPAPPCVLVLTTYSDHNIKAAILDAYLMYEKRYKEEHKGKKPPFNIREDRTHKEHFAIKKAKMQKAARARKEQATRAVKKGRKNSKVVREEIMVEAICM